MPLLGFIADFYAPSARLIVEVDGGYHARRMTADARRDLKLERAGYRVVRVQAELVTRDLPAALRAILQALREALQSFSRTHSFRPLRTRNEEPRGPLSAASEG